MADFPGSLPDLKTTHQTDDTIEAATDNAHAAEINAIAAELGTNPAGDAETVGARIAAVESTVGLAGSAITSHTSATTSVHGIADTADLIVEGDSRLDDAREPTVHASSHATGQSDEIEPGDIGAATASDLTDLETLLSTSGVGFVAHGSTAATARPSGFGRIFWIGSVKPDNWVDGDLGVGWEA